MGTFDRTRVLSIWAFLPDEHYSLIYGTFSSDDDDDGKENVRNISSNEQNTGSTHAIHTLVYFFAVL